ncbi:MAG: ABC transporter permease, partial [Hyphomicrobiales bacterium]
MGEKSLAVNERLLLGILGFATFVGLWSALSVSGAVPRQFLPAPWDVLSRAAALTSQPFAGSTLQGHLFSSLQRF